LEYKKIENPVINPYDWVTVTDMGHLQEVQYLQHRNNEATIRKLDKDHYEVVKTGETKAFNHSENRKDSLNSLRQTFKKLRYLINANFRGNSNELHCVLTYPENMRDTKRLYSDVKNFVLRLKYYFKDSTTIDYINVVEPQGRGAWHCHLLLRFNDVEKIFIPNAELRKMWRHGFVTIKSLRDVDNVGAYLSAYLTDLDIDDNTSTGVAVEKLVNNSDGTVTSKRVIKGARLHLYPTGMRLYRKSKGIVEPDRKVMLYSVFKEKVGESANPHYRTGIHLSDEDGYENNIIYEQYNLKRKKNQS
jgi:hypothetical protein